MAGINEAKAKVEKGLHKGICETISHSFVDKEDYYYSELKLEKEVIMTSMNVLIEGTELSFNQEAHGSDLEIAKNILPKDKIELHILDDYCAIWLKEGETFDKEKHLFNRCA